jgi:hypothetical protein
MAVAQSSDVAGFVSNTVAEVRGTPEKIVELSADLSAAARASGGSFVIEPNAVQLVAYQTYPDGGPNDTGGKDNDLERIRNAVDTERDPVAPFIPLIIAPASTQKSVVSRAIIKPGLGWSVGAFR